MFKTDTKEKRAYLWAFLLIVAATIKYLEIEISSMAQFDLKNKSKTASKTDRSPKAWKGFIIPPTYGSPNVNFIDDEIKDDDEHKGHRSDSSTSMKLESSGTIVINANMDRRKTVDAASYKICDGCYRTLKSTKWFRNGKPYCDLCLVCNI